MQYDVMVNKMKELGIQEDADYEVSFSELVSQLFGGSFQKKLSKHDIYRIISQPGVFLFFHVEDKKIVGMALLYVVRLMSRVKGVIEEVVTLEKYRNRGIGSSLVKQAIKKAQELGITCIELNVREDKPGVQKFYEDLGFYDRKNKSMRLWVNKQ